MQSTLFSLMPVEVLLRAAEYIDSVDAVTLWRALGDMRRARATDALIYAKYNKFINCVIESQHSNCYTALYKENSIILDNRVHALAVWKIEGFMYYNLIKCIESTCWTRPHMPIPRCIKIRRIIDQSDIIEMRKNNKKN
jgi:hypothetical protein